MGCFRLISLLLVLHIAAVASRSHNIRLEGNGYTNLVIAVNPGVPEDQNIITKLQDMVKSASDYLFSATRHRFYFKEVKILLPLTWAPVNYTKGRTESYEKANVIVAEPYLKHGDDPYTLQYDECGQMGQYIHLTPKFLLDDTMIGVYGPRGKVFVHEWAHLRWGVYDEYNEQKPFYISMDKKAEPTRCSKDISGSTGALSCKGSSCSVETCTIDPATSLPTENCKFFPDKNQNTATSLMFLQSLSSVTEFCAETTHNSEAPNMQNKMCNYRSVWEVIRDSEDFKGSTSMTTIPPPPKFTLIQQSDRVVCFVLDVSGSMSGNRLKQLQQAAEIFLRQIIEEGSWVGIVTFSSVGNIVKELTLIESDASRIALVNKLPTTANGGTEICRGIDKGFEVLRKDDAKTDSDEIILLTDGINNTPVNCLAKVQESGAIVHTIAFGESADKILYNMSSDTGGLFFTALDQVDSTSLIDAFAAIRTSDGNLTKQSIQLESSGQKMKAKDWFNGTVSIDKSVGKDTFFVVTWETTMPDMYVRSPGGQTYENVNFTVEASFGTARLNIPGIAQTGAWTYSLYNTLTTIQSLTMTVTSRAADANVPPVTVNSHMNQDTSTGNAPMVVYAEVKQGFLPVVHANVTAVIETETGIRTTLQLLDEGGAPDLVRNDGIYSRYFINLQNGRHSLKVNVQGSNGTTRLAVRRQGRAMYIPGYVKDGKIELNPEKPPVNEEDLQLNLGSFSRTTSGGGFTVTLDPNAQPPSFPPSRITDLDAELKDYKVFLSWTAPGEDFDQGTAESYEIRMSTNFEELRNNFSAGLHVNTQCLSPKLAGSKETFIFSPKEIPIENGTIIYFAARANDNQSLSADVSNIAQASMIMPPPTEIDSINITTIVLAVTGSVVAICIIASTTMCILKRKKCFSA
ncbi:calcium-activated chloride channel regulator 1-like [Acipenser oxyrinchus oxyrinchus]|uniref:Calcium-activated chloride channel regulator 1-like n=1 Tax=Acipenser oxyrinchus oxyrinchus TaxID=40147 RepID=A0AAD8DC07_ACIOX|nr:calcium-activated chloride channel regulator 1-like [Acipenser oxyrinchus oxyrinchus]